MCIVARFRLLRVVDILQSDFPDRQYRQGAERETTCKLYQGQGRKPDLPLLLVLLRRRTRRRSSRDVEQADGFTPFW